MLHSKKYVKLFDQLQSKQKQTEYQCFQFPLSAEDPNAFEILANHVDPYFSFLDKSIIGSDNQLFYMCQLITRIFM